MKRLLALLLVAVMALGIVACAKAPATTTTSGKDTNNAAPVDNKDSKDTTAAPDTTGGDEVPYLGEVEILNGAGASAGLCVGWMPDYIRREIGVDMIGLPGGNDQVATGLAAGVLPDITIIKKTDDLDAAIQGGMILDLETVKDKLPNVFENYWDANRGMVNYLKAVKSAGTGKLYGLARMYNAVPVPADDVGGIFLRYDVYGQVGYPEIKNYDDLLDCLAAMQAAYPTTPDGKKVYAISYFNDWDNGTTRAYNYVWRSRGYWGRGIWTVDMKGYDGSIESMKLVKQMEKGSDYYDFIKFMFKANQAGLVDPNTLSQTPDDSEAKVKSGEVLLQWDAWGTDYDMEQQNQGIGYCRVPIGEYFANDMDISYGSDTVVTISSNCKNLEAACALVNLMYDPAYVLSYMNGPRYQVWDYDENGDPYFVEGGYEAMNNLDFTERGCIVMLTYHFCGLVPGCSDGVTFDFSSWPSYDDMLADGTIVETKLMQDWKEHTSNGHRLLTDYFKDNDKLILIPSIASRSKSTDEQMVEDRLNQRVTTGSWACMYAADEATFEAEWDSMYNDIVSLGYDDFCEQQFDYLMDQVLEFRQYID